MPKTRTNADITPIRNAPTALTASQPAVIATKPPSEPFRVIDMSGFLYLIHVMIITAHVAAAAAKLVLKMMLPIATRLSSPVADTVEPPLKPNHANQSMKTPRAPIVRLCPGMALTLPSESYFPILGPSI